ncbi:MAG: hypothetical protein J0H48_11915 [Nitrosospira multiformis]|nr:hypothetical protein [Nitrosospira multiformis]
MDSIETIQTVETDIARIPVSKLVISPSMPERSREPASMKWLPEDKDLLH